MLPWEIRHGRSLAPPPPRAARAPVNGAQPRSRRLTGQPAPRSSGGRALVTWLPEFDITICDLCGLFFDRGGAKIADVCVRRVRRQRASIRSILCRVRPCYLGGWPRWGRMGGIGVTGCRRGPDHRGRHGVDGGGHRIRRSLVVDPPSDEVRPGLGRVALDREPDLAHPGYRVQELGVGQAGRGVRAGLVGDVEAHRLGDPVEAPEPAAQAQPARTTGAAWGDRARNSAAESSTASSEITQDDSAYGERNRTSTG